MHRWPVLALLSLTGIATPIFAASRQAASCSKLGALTLPHTKILDATVTEAGTFTPPGGGDPGTARLYEKLPAFCRVTAQAMPTADSDIRIEVWLPLTGWNGKFRGQGNGGFAGAIDYPLLALSVAQHYATAATDTGHEGKAPDAATDGSWALHHPEKIKDFGYRGIHLMTTTARSVVDSFYGKPADRAYFASCSDGGREALMEAQRYPADYDGILAGAPAYYWTNMVSAALHKVQVATSTAQSFVSPAKVPAIAAAVRLQCDAKDGVEDGILNDPRQCHFDPAVLMCKGAESDACLTGPQVATLKAIYAPTKDDAGGQIYPGSMPGGEEGPGGWGIWVLGDTPEKSLGYAFVKGYFSNMVYNDPHWEPKSVSYENALKMADNTTGAALNATDPNLRAFASHGGKLILYHGWNDPAISPLSTIDYYQHVTDINTDGKDNAANFVRLFMVPGMQHCQGGPGATSFGQFGYRPGTGLDDPQHDLYLGLEQWVERGTVPNQVIAAKVEARKDAAAAITMTRPLCAWPKEAVYKGSGDAKDAASFVCTASR